MQKTTKVLLDSVLTTCYVGQWIEAPRNTAIRLLIEERARVLDYPALLTEYGSIKWWGGEKARAVFALHTPLIDEPECLNNILIAPERGELKTPISILIGLQALQNWHVAIPLYKDRLILGLGSEQEQFDTKEIIRDLRVPAYDGKYIFYRNSEHGKRWYLEYEKQLEGGTNREHALIRALYITKPYHIALPANSIR